MFKMPPALLALALCAFSIGTTELVIVGLLPDPMCGFFSGPGPRSRLPSKVTKPEKTEARTPWTWTPSL